MEKHRGPGRPRKPESEKLVSVNLRLTPEMLKWIDERGQSTEPLTRSAVVRRVLAEIIEQREPS